MSYECRVIADSVAPNGMRLVTMEIMFPRVLLSELRTHRQILQDDEVEMTFRGVDEAGRSLSLNSASSRAIPVDKMLRLVRDAPYLPEFTGAQKGMQGREVADAEWQRRQADRVRRMRDSVMAEVEAMLADGVHKQDANRYLEAFAWHTVIISATDWSNFFAQRCHADAYPPFRRLAELMRREYEDSSPRVLRAGEWHLPYVTDEERDTLSGGGEDFTLLLKLCVARCARVSYLSHAGVRDLEADYALFDRLIQAGHWSPFEHAAMAGVASFKDHIGNFQGWVQYRKRFANECR